MSDDSAPLFEAVCTPPSSLGRGGARVLAAAILTLSSGVAVLLLALGAWPVLGFTGAEIALALGLLALHRRHAARRREWIRLLPDGLLVARVDARGRRSCERLDPYWTRVALEPREGRVSRLELRQRDRVLEIGRYLGEAQKSDLAGALADALRRWREPIFDNPQLRQPSRSASGS